MNRIGKAGILTAGLFFSLTFGLSAQTSAALHIDWSRMSAEIRMSLDLNAAQLKMPNGRSRGDDLLDRAYRSSSLALLRSLPFDSSRTIGDLIDSGEWSETGLSSFSAQARKQPSYLSIDLSTLNAVYTLDLKTLAETFGPPEGPDAELLPLSAVSTRAYTGIIIMASGTLAVHGRAGSASTQACLFPKIWDSDMKQLCDRTMFLYATDDEVFQNRPSGLSERVRAVVGDNPLRIIATSLFGVNTTDPILNREDALLILGSEENRSLLSAGKLALVINNQVVNNQVVNSSPSE